VSKIDDGGPAFPLPAAFNPDGTGIYEEQRGMSLRDYFAALAMQQMIVLAVEGHLDGVARRKAGQIIADESYAMADFMLAERAKAEGR